MTDPDLRARVAAHPFLAGMSPHHLELLADCAAHQSFEAGQVVFNAGDPARGFYLVERGRIAVEGVTENQRPTTIDVVEAGEPLGWSWIFEPFICEYGGRALEPTSAIFFDAAALTTHRAADLTLGHELFKRMSQIMVRRLTAARAKLLETAAREEQRA